MLRTLAEAIREKLAYVNTLPDDTKAVSSIAFVKAGSSITNKQAERHRQLGLLAGARDWSCDFDLPEYHHFPRPPYELPADVGAISNRIDAFIVSRKTQVIIAGPELTVPMEDNLEKQHTLKMERYQGMASCLHPGWRLAGKFLSNSLSQGSQHTVVPPLVPVLDHSHCLRTDGQLAR